MRIFLIFCFLISFVPCSLAFEDEVRLSLPEKALFSVSKVKKEEILPLKSGVDVKNIIANYYNSHEGVEIKTLEKEITPVTPQQYEFQSRISKNDISTDINMLRYMGGELGSKFLPQMYSLPPQAKVLYSKDGDLHPNSYSQSVSMLANGLLLNQVVEEIVFDKETERSNNNAHFWYKPISSSEGNLLSSSVHVTNTFYGLAAGFDSKLYKIDEKSSLSYGVFGAVIDSNSRYRGVNTFANGALLGANASYYRNKSFALLNTKINFNHHLSSGQYGIDDYQSIFAGVSLKTGSTFPLLKDRFRLQHYHMYSYTYGESVDYENSARMLIGTANLSNFWTTHGMKIFARNENNTKPYLNLGMAINLFGGEIDQNVNGERVNSLELDDYFICGAGIEKEIKDKFSGFWEVSAKATGRIRFGSYFGLKWQI